MSFCTVLPKVADIQKIGPASGREIVMEFHGDPALGMKK